MYIFMGGSFLTECKNKVTTFWFAIFLWTDIFICNFFSIQIKNVGKSSFSFPTGHILVYIHGR